MDSSLSGLHIQNRGRSSVPLNNDECVLKFMLFTFDFGVK
jgi:hypothetical protein